MSRRVGFFVNSTACALYLFLFAPLFVVVLRSFQESRFGGAFSGPFSLHWYIELFHNPGILSALKTSLWLGAVAGVASTAAAIPAAAALSRFGGRARNLLNTLFLTPILIPEVILGVALLLFLRTLGRVESPALLLAGHTAICFPYAFLPIRARLEGIGRDMEDAAMTLGASPLRAFVSVTLPLLVPAVLAGFLFAFTISFDNVTATLFWAGAGVETLPLKVFGMARNGVTPQVHALGVVMIVMTLLLPLVGGRVVRGLRA